MKKILTNIFESALSSVGMYWPYLLKHNSQLTEDGWFLSAKGKSPVDRYNNPIPWMTYSFLDFIKNRLKPNFTVFEYGCGNSTIWLANQVKSVVSTEHDSGWYEKIKNGLPKNARLLNLGLEDGDKYESACTHQGSAFDIIIIDGRKRIKCSQYAANSVTKDGIIIWDNTEREEYVPGIEELKSKGFKRIDFWGMSPMNVHKTCTTLFYRTENCLGI